MTAGQLKELQQQRHSNWLSVDSYGMQQQWIQMQEQRMAGAAADGRSSGWQEQRMAGAPDGRSSGWHEQQEQEHVAEQLR